MTNSIQRHFRNKKYNSRWYFNRNDCKDQCNLDYYFEVLIPILGCSKCLHNYYSPGNRKRDDGICQKCMPKGCFLCPAGTFRAYAQDNVCLPGYKNTPACFASLSVANTQYYDPSICRLCPVGKFWLQVHKNTLCSDSCIRGTIIRNVTFSTASILDKPIHTGGNFSSQIRSVCEPCAVGKIEWAGVCRSCSSGKYQDMEGGTDACKICPSGKYAKDVGASMCKSCIIFEITDRRATKCMLNPVIYLVWGIAVAIFGFNNAESLLSFEGIQCTANKTFQDDLNALGGMDTLTNLRTSLLHGRH